MQQRVALNGKESERLTIKASVPQSLILGRLYVNDLLDNLESNVELFEDDTSRCAVGSDPISTSQKLNKYFHKVDLWDSKWKTSVNKDPSKQALEVILSRKISKLYHLSILFNNCTIRQI